MLAAKIDFRIYSCHLMIIIISKHLRMSVFNRRWLHWRLGPFDTFGLIGVSPSLIGLQRCFMKSAPQLSSHYSNCDFFFSPVLAIFFFHYHHQPHPLTQLLLPLSPNLRKKNRDEPASKPVCSSSTHLLKIISLKLLSPIPKIFFKCLWLLIFVSLKESSHFTLSSLCILTAIGSQ